MVYVGVDLCDAAGNLAKTDVGSDIEAGYGERAEEYVGMLPDLPFDIAHRELFTRGVEHQILLSHLALLLEDVVDDRGDKDRDNDGLGEVKGEEPDGDACQKRSAARNFFRVKEVDGNVGKHDADSGHHGIYYCGSDPFDDQFVEAKN